MSAINDSALSQSGEQSMKTWKKTIGPILLAMAGVLLVFAGLEELVIDGGPLHPAWISFGFLYFVLALVFFARGRKSGGGTGPPNAGRAVESGGSGREAR